MCWQSDYASVSVETQQPRANSKPKCEFKFDQNVLPKLSCDSAITEVSMWHSPSRTYSCVAQVSAWVTFLQSPVGDNWGAVHSIGYSPDGSQLAVTSGIDPNIIIWDMATEQPTVLRALVAGSTLVRWSPSGHFLFVATK